LAIEILLVYRPALCGGRDLRRAQRPGLQPDHEPARHGGASKNKTCLPKKNHANLPPMAPKPTCGDIEPHRPHRLRRLKTVWTLRGRPLFFVTICTAKRQAWLGDKVIHDAFREFCARSPTQAAVWIGKYVLMPDHIHVFVSAEGSQSLSRWVAALKGYLGAIKRRQQIPGPAWQTGFFDHLLRSSESSGDKWNYVCMNPVRAGLVAKPEDWPYAGEIDFLLW